MTTHGEQQAFADENNVGLTKREYFAALALQGILSNAAILERHGLPASDVSRNAVEQADALIAALNEVPPHE